MAKPSSSKLTPQQELFCRFFTQNRELFANATHSYAEAYGFNLDELSHLRGCGLEESEDHAHAKDCPPSEYDLAYHTCSSLGSRLLRNDRIQNRITALLNEMLRDDVVDAELVKTILQDHKLDAKIAAIREYNKLKQRITDKVEHSGEVSITWQP